MADKFRIAIVGAGMITAQSHLPAVLASSCAELVGIVDADRARAEALARSYGLAVKVGTDVGDLLGEIDGAIVATPNSSHRDLAIRCLDAGVHVLVEKPLALTSADGERILAAARNAGRVVAVGYVTRFYPSAQLLEGLLRERYFGRVHSFRHQFGTTGGWAPVSGYILDRSASGGGVLVVTGTHFLDRMLHLWGYPEKVTYFDDSRGGPEANCRAEFVFHRDGEELLGSVRYSKSVKIPGGLVLETDAGLVQQSEGIIAPVVLRPRQAPHLEHLIQVRGAAKSSQSPFLLQLEDFIRACREGGKPAADGEAGVQSLRLVEQLYAARQPMADQWYPLAEVG
jgi:predicted dehydrogenase